MGTKLKSTMTSHNDTDTWHCNATCTDNATCHTHGLDML